jgi:hypothetical protein
MIQDQGAYQQSGGLSYDAKPKENQTAARQRGAVLPTLSNTLRFLLR